MNPSKTGRDMSHVSRTGRPAGEQSSTGDEELGVGGRWRTGRQLVWCSGSREKAAQVGVMKERGEAEARKQRPRRHEVVRSPLRRVTCKLQLARVRVGNGQWPVNLGTVWLTESFLILDRISSNGSKQLSSEMFPHRITPIRKNDFGSESANTVFRIHSVHCTSNLPLSCKLFTHTKCHPLLFNCSHH
jgi:hypothetical protein